MKFSKVLWAMNLNETQRAKEFHGKNILAIDFGEKFSGIAMFKPGFDLDPWPFGRISYKSDLQVITELNQIISDELVEVMVCGVPYFTDGKESTMTKRVKEFAGLLQKKIPADVDFYTQDETLSTFEAKDRMMNSARYNFKVDMKKIDEVAATIILEDFLLNKGI